MEMKQVMVPVADIYVTDSGISLLDSARTLVENLSKAEINRYQYALSKIGKGITLNRKDLALFDKIDALTHKHHGMCLKDSKVTKARIKACNKFNKTFVDRDHLVDHMNIMLSEADEEQSEVEFYEAFGEFMASRLGADAMYELHDLIGRVNEGVDLSLSDLEILSKLEEIVFDELGWSIGCEDIKNAISKASKKLGVFFPNLQGLMTH